MDTQRWQDWTTTLAGVWLILSPFLLPAFGSEGLAETAFWSQIVSGLVVMALGLAALYAYQVWEEPVDALVGLWIIVSPWVLGFAGLAAFALTNVLAGLVVLGLAGWMTFDTSHKHA